MLCLLLPGAIFPERFDSVDDNASAISSEAKSKELICVPTCANIEYFIFLA